MAEKRLFNEVRRAPTVSTIPSHSDLSIKSPDGLTRQVYNGDVLYKEYFVSLSLLLEMGISDYL